jgi:predicted Rossmann fold nucleotide-binding protein DprA/Smf involved in DNA uptake
MLIEPLIIEPTSASFPAALKDQEGGIVVSRLWAMGPIDLLQKPLLGLFCSARCPGEVILRSYDLARALRDAGVPVISGFHSPLEKECLDLLLRGSQPVVICPARSIERLRLPIEWRQAVEDGRLLILSPFAGRHRRPTVQLAEQRNDCVAALAGCVVVAYAAPGSKTEQFCQLLLSRQRPVILLDSAVNESLLALGARALSIDRIIGLVRL